MRLETSIRFENSSVETSSGNRRFARLLLSFLSLGVSERISSSELTIDTIASSSTDAASPTGCSVLAALLCLTSASEHPETRAILKTKIPKAFIS